MTDCFPLDSGPWHGVGQSTFHKDFTRIFPQRGGKADPALPTGSFSWVRAWNGQGWYPAFSAQPYTIAQHTKMNVAICFLRTMIVGVSVYLIKASETPHRGGFHKSILLPPWVQLFILDIYSLAFLWSTFAGVRLEKVNCGGFKPVNSEPRLKLLASCLYKPIYTRPWWSVFVACNMFKT